MTLTLQPWNSMFEPFCEVHTLASCQFNCNEFYYSVFACSFFLSRYHPRIAMNEKKSINFVQIRELNAGRSLHEKMMQFKTSVPLMAKLQNDSLRDRHWQHLMKKTGHHFNTDPKEFRLSDMFAMNLYRHQVRILHTKYNIATFQIKFTMECSNAK